MTRIDGIESSAFDVTLDGHTATNVSPCPSMHPQVMGDLAAVAESQLRLEKGWTRVFGSTGEDGRSRKALLVLLGRSIDAAPIRIKEFFYLCGLPPASGNRLLMSLEQSGLITREADLADGRCHSVRVTELCIQKVAAVYAMVAQQADDTGGTFIELASILSRFMPIL